MKNREVARILAEIADFLELQNVDFKPRAYRRAARNVESLAEPIEDIAERGELEEIEGVGASIAEKIQEYLETGELEYYEELKADLPIDIDAITSVEGVGPKTAKTLYLELGITDLDDLERAANAGDIAELEGFGPKTQQNILDHLELAKRGQERMLLGRAFPIAKNIEERLRDSDAFDRVDIVGSFRRRQPTIGDLDILASPTDVEAAMDAFCEHPDVKEILGRGDTKASVIVAGDLRMDLRLLVDDEYGAGLVYFTGSKDHNITLRTRAIARDLKLNEYGLFDIRDVPDPSSGLRVGDRVAGETEESIYGALDLEWIPPELREDTGEIAAAAAGALPDLVELTDIRGDLQVHTEYSDGSHTVAQMAEAADERGLEYILITDHGPGAPIPSRLDAESFEEQRATIAAVNDRDDLDVVVLQGIEAEITRNGLVIGEEWFEHCDLVVVAMHGRRERATELFIETFEQAPVDIFAHPSNRLINEREPLDLDWDAVMEAAADHRVAIEINAQPARLDLDWAQVKEYRDLVDFVVSTDAHTTGEFDFLHLGVSQARRGWCTADDILNTLSIDELRQSFKRRSS